MSSASAATILSEASFLSEDDICGTTLSNLSGRELHLFLFLIVNNLTFSAYDSDEDDDCQGVILIN